MRKEVRRRVPATTSYSAEEIKRWIKLKNTIDDTGHELTWREVSELTRVGADVMKAIVSRYRHNKRKGVHEQYKKLREKIQAEIDAGKTSIQISRKLKKNRFAIARHVRLMGYQLEDRKLRDKPVRDR